MGPLSYVFLGVSLATFALGISALVESRDVAALFFLSAGAICARCAPRLAASGARK